MTDALTKRWIKNASDEHAVSQGCYFDEDAAQRVVQFFSRFLRHSKGRWAGQPFELFDWQYEELIAPLFGWMRSDGLRRFRTAYVELPKKNGKSAIASGIGLYLLMADREPGAEVYSLACDRAQASIVHGEAIRMVESSEALSNYLRINRTTSNISFDRANAWYRAVSSESENKEGLNAHGLICDELHAWKGQPGRRLFSTIKWAGAAREQPLLFCITTAGDDVKSICYEQYLYAKQILNGTVQDPRFFALIKEANLEDDWQDESTWRKANPSLGLTIHVDDFRSDCEEAKSRPSEQSAFKRYRLNIWSSSTNPWLRIEDWQACHKEFDVQNLESITCFGGLDLSKTRDFTALALVWPMESSSQQPEIDADFFVKCFFWLPEDLVSDPGSPEEYRVWRDQGWLEATPGNVIDYSWVKNRMGELVEQFQIQEFAYDPYNAEQVTQEIEDQVGIERILFPQTIVNYAEPSREFERLVISKRIAHDGNPILSWMIGNVAVKSDVNRNIRPVKPEEGDSRKIDGVTATIMGLARAIEGSYQNSGDSLIILE